MRLYSFICRSCRRTWESESPERVYICCDVLMARDYTTIQLAVPVFTPHFNHAVGAYVQTDREFRDVMKRGQDRQSEATGIDHTYVPHYPGDIPQPTKSDAVFETQMKAHHDKKVPSVIE